VVGVGGLDAVVEDYEPLLLEADPYLAVVHPVGALVAVVHVAVGPAEEPIDVVGELVVSRELRGKGSAAGGGGGSSSRGGDRCGVHRCTKNSGGLQRGKGTSGKRMD
jgi:hypothetical protein